MSDQESFINEEDEVQGEKGDKGDKGDQGDQGIQGPRSLNAWFSAKEPIITFTFFLILSVISFATIYSARQTQDAIKKADLIVQCTTPGTRCYNLSQQQSAQRLKEIKAAAFCVVDAISSVPLQDWQANRAKLLAAYNNCVAEESK